MKMPEGVLYGWGELEDWSCGYQFGEVVYEHVREPLRVWVQPGRVYIDSDDRGDVLAYDVSAERYKHVLECFVHVEEPGAALRCFLAADAIRQRYRELIHANPGLERQAMQKAWGANWVKRDDLVGMIYEDVAKAYADTLTNEQHEEILAAWMAVGSWDLDDEEYRPDPAMIAFMLAAYPEHAESVRTLETLIHDAAQGCMLREDKARAFIKTFFAKKDTESFELPDLDA